MNLINLLTALLIARIAATLFGKVGIASFTAYIITGYLLGPNVLRVMDEINDLLLNLSLIMLFFYVGLNINLRTAKYVLKDSIKLSFTCMFTVIALTTAALIVMNYDIVTVLIVAIALSNTATEVVMLALNELGIHSRVRDVLIIASFIDDLALIIFIAFMGFLTPDNPLEIWAYSFKVLLYSSVILITGYVLSNKLSTYLMDVKVAINTAIVILLLITVFGYLIGIDLTFSAYLAGLFIGFLRLIKDPTLVNIIRLEDLIRYLAEVLDLILIPIFFLYVGMTLDTSSMLTPDFVVIAATALAGKFVGGVLANYRDLRLGLMYGIAMNARGALEPALILLALKSGLISLKTYSIIISLSIITSALIPLLLRIIYTKIIH